jgi:hypothetical protein
MLGAEQLTANRAGEGITADIGTKERGKDGKRTAGVDRNGGASRVKSRELEAGSWM